MSLRDQVDVAEQLLTRIEIPMLPKEVLELQKLFRESNTPDPQKIKALISVNPYLAGELISLANLPTISNRGHAQVKDLDSAIYRLGNKQLKNFILSVYIKNLINENKIKGLSFHSQVIAIAAYEVARHCSFITPDEAFLLGIMHDIGTFAMTELDQNYGNTFVGKLIEHYTSHKKEYSHYGTSHSALGYVIAKSWSMPAYISQTILLHHEPRLNSIKYERLRKLTALIQLAHAIIIKINHQNETPEESSRSYQEAQAILELDDDEMKKIQASICETLESEMAE